MFLIRRIDSLLNSVTMYRLLVYGLSALGGIGIVFSSFNILSLSATGLVASLGILLVVGYAVSELLKKLYSAPANADSSLITSLILFCILPPVTTWQRAVATAVAVTLAIAAKYIIAIRYKHIFNPAACGAAIVGLIGLLHATWWVGSSSLLPFSLLLGLLIVRKIRRFRLVVSFTLAALLMMVVNGLHNDQTVPHILHDAFTSWPLVFFGTVMLTEPATTPPTTRLRVTYGVLVGLLFASQTHAGQISSTPENVLLIGNLFAYAVSPKFRLRLKLKERRQIADHIYEFVFTSNKKLNFKAGQYMDWTLPLRKLDARGNRRTFTIASSPTENDIRLGIKTYEPSSQFKQALLQMKPGYVMTAGQLAGDFTLPKDPAEKLVFIAGGIGVTPFRSMLKYLNDCSQKRDIVLFYSVAAADQIAYRDILESSATVVYVLGSKEIPKNWHGETGFITPEMINKYVPDYADRRFYISGPPVMVDNYRRLLRTQGVLRRNIVTDHFSGY
jgi:ferredoxin-NADP reductase/Na+-translocating ferredoxin:NAD+ oxidoreductase RnfD subunit